MNYSISVSKSLDAPQQAVWDVLADFGNIADWNTGIGTSYLTGGPEDVAVGTKRHCDLSPTGALEETLIVMDEPNRAVVSIDEAKRIPVKRGEAEFLLQADGDRCRTTINYAFEPNGGPLAPLIARMLQGQLQKGFSGFLDDLEKAAQAAAV